MSNWLASNGLTECCQDSFSKHDINGLVLSRLSDVDVHSPELGIESTLAKTKLLAALDALRANATIESQAIPEDVPNSTTEGTTMKDVGFRGFL